MTTILDQVKETYGGNLAGLYDTDLKRWANQGVLHFNTSLTVGMFTEKSHREIWYDFIGSEGTQINALRQDIIFVFFGDIARDWEELID